MVGETRVRGSYSREAREALQQALVEYKPKSHDPATSRLCAARRALASSWLHLR